MILAAPRHSRLRMSMDSCWPLLCADGMTFAQRKALRDKREARRAKRMAKQQKAQT